MPAKFITLNEGIFNENPRPLRVNVDHLQFYRAHRVINEIPVTQIGLHGTWIDVMETPEEIDALLEGPKLAFLPPTPTVDY